MPTAQPTQPSPRKLCAVPSNGKPSIAEKPAQKDNPGARGADFAQEKEAQLGPSIPRPRLRHHRARPCGRSLTGSPGCVARNRLRPRQRACTGIIEAAAAAGRAFLPDFYEPARRVFRGAPIKRLPGILRRFTALAGSPVLFPVIFNRARRCPSSGDAVDRPFYFSSANVYCEPAGLSLYAPDSWLRWGLRGC